MRTFIAVDIAEPLKDKLRALQKEMQQFNSPVRWVSPDGFHVTLKFLGEVAESQLPAIGDQLTGIARQFQPFQVSVEGLGTFPRAQSPRVIWVGVRSDEDQLIRLGTTVESAMIPLGFPAEARAFNPHLTLGRVKGADNLFRLMTYIKLYSDRQILGSFSADAMFVYKSTLTPAGSRYEKLRAFPFGQ